MRAVSLAVTTGEGVPALSVVDSVADVLSDALERQGLIILGLGEWEENRIILDGECADSVIVGEALERAADDLRLRGWRGVTLEEVAGE